MLESSYGLLALSKAVNKALHGEDYIFYGILCGSQCKAQQVARLMEGGEYEGTLSPQQDMRSAKHGTTCLPGV